MGRVELTRFYWIPCRVFNTLGSIAVAGLALRWLRDQLNLIGDYKECETLAATVANTGGVYFVPAFSGLYAPCK